MYVSLRSLTTDYQRKKIDAFTHLKANILNIILLRRQKGKRNITSNMWVGRRRVLHSILVGVLAKLLLRKQKSVRRSHMGLVTIFFIYTLQQFRELLRLS